MLFSWLRHWWAESDVSRCRQPLRSTNTQTIPVDHRKVVKIKKSIGLCRSVHSKREESYFNIRSLIQSANVRLWSKSFCRTGCVQSIRGEFYFQIIHNSILFINTLFLNSFFFFNLATPYCNQLLLTRLVITCSLISSYPVFNDL